MKCGKPVKKHDHQTSPCVRTIPHIEGHCNPFSDSYTFPEDQKIIRQLQEKFNAEIRTKINMGKNVDMDLSIATTEETKEK